MAPAALRTLTLFKKLPCEITTSTHPSKANKAEAKALEGGKPLSRLSSDEEKLHGCNPETFN